MSLRRPPSAARAPAAGASAAARYAELRAQGRTKRRALLAAAALAGAVLGFTLAGWRTALVGALWAAAAVLVWQWRTDHEATWAKGARGERKTARILRRLERRGYVVLHDRGIPRSRANLDHLVITPTGSVVVVDSKKWARNRIVKSGGRRGWVRVGRMRGDKVVASASWEARRVYEVLTADPLLVNTVPHGFALRVCAVLAVHGAKLPAWRTVYAEGVPLLRARKVPRWIEHTTELHDGDPSGGALIAEACQRLFPPYGGQTPAEGAKRAGT